jgi:hypothetical protein
MDWHGAFDWVRRVVVFVLGVAVIVDSLHNKTSPVAELVVGMIMVGILPLDDLARFLGRRGSK